ncbi:MAG: DUF4493 domain-containing protein [Bacteroides sp.]|nr:DUF4493 domain-containing protein [Bacteroides sp.]
MKRNYIFLFCAATLFSLGACEMSDELSGDKEEKAGTGTLELNVATKTPSALTRTVDAAAADFPVTITNSEDKVVASYAKATDLPSSIKLTVGDYTVAAHTPGDLIRTMSAPYYGGSVDLPITKDVTTERTVTCTMQNSRIEVNYDPTFLDNFTSWTVTVNDGGENAPSFDEKNTDPAPVYLLFGDKVATVNVDIKAVTIKDETVSASFALTKADATEGYDNVENGTYFVGGDAIIITLKPTEMLEGSVSGLNYSAQIVFGETEENVVIVVDDVPLVADDEEEGGDDENAIVISEPNGTTYLTNGLTWVGDENIAKDSDGNVITDAEGKTTYNYPTDVLIRMESEHGLKNVYVLVESDNSDFVYATSLMGLTTAPGLDLASSEASSLAELFDLPQVGQTTYDFTLKTTIFDLLAANPGYNGTHKFILKAVDSKNNVSTATLVINITVPTVASGESSIDNTEEGGE